MKIAVLSDSHDNIWKLEGALEEAQEAEVWIHCGDLCAPFVVKQMGEGAQGRPVHVVWGNNDADARLICRIASGFDDFHLHGQLAEITLGGRKIAVNHYPEIARPLAKSGDYDLVCYGHDHTRHLSQVGNTMLLNPGEIMGMKGPATIAMVDLKGMDVEFREIPGR
ncbi:MAG TPA: metallophosphoesterase [Acidobacteriota bacterium]|nr:metallophosphoesterase [Acidobacteriota bacterium]